MSSKNTSSRLCGYLASSTVQRPAALIDGDTDNSAWNTIETQSWPNARALPSPYLGKDAINPTEATNPTLTANNSFHLHGQDVAPPSRLRRNLENAKAAYAVTAGTRQSTATAPRPCFRGDLAELPSPASRVLAPVRAASRRCSRGDMAQLPGLPRALSLSDIERDSCDARESGAARYRLGMDARFAASSPALVSLSPAMVDMIKAGAPARIPDAPSPRRRWGAASCRPLHPLAAGSFEDRGGAAARRDGRGSAERHAAYSQPAGGPVAGDNNLPPSPEPRPSLQAGGRLDRSLSFGPVATGRRPPADLVGRAAGLCAPPPSSRTTADAEEPPAASEAREQAGAAAKPGGRAGWAASAASAFRTALAAAGRRPSGRAEEA